MKRKVFWALLSGVLTMGVAGGLFAAEDPHPGTEVWKHDTFIDMRPSPNLDSVVFIKQVSQGMLAYPGEASFYNPVDGSLISTISFEPKTLRYAFGQDAVLSSVGTNLSGYSYRDGKKLFSIAMPNALSAYTNVGGKLVVWYGAQIFIYNAANGAKIGEFTRAQQGLFGSPQFHFIGSKLVVFWSGLMNKFIVNVLDLDTGQTVASIESKLRSEDIYMKSGAAYNTPVIRGSILYVFSKGVSCIDLDKSKELWAVPFNDAAGDAIDTQLSVGFTGTNRVNNAAVLVDYKPFFLSDTKMAVYDISGKIYCIDSLTGKVLWKSGGLGPISEISMIGGKLYAFLGTTYSGYADSAGKGPFGIVKLDPDTGKTLWTYKQNDPIRGIYYRQDAFLVFYKIGYLTVRIDNGKAVDKIKFRGDIFSEGLIGTAPTGNPDEYFLMTGKEFVRYNVASANAVFSCKLGEHYYRYLIRPGTAGIELFMICPPPSTAFDRFRTRFFLIDPATGQIRVSFDVGHAYHTRNGISDVITTFYHFPSLNGYILSSSKWDIDNSGRLNSGTFSFFKY